MDTLPAVDCVQILQAPHSVDALGFFRLRSLMGKEFPPLVRVTGIDRLRMALIWGKGFRKRGVVLA